MAQELIRINGLAGTSDNDWKTREDFLSASAIGGLQMQPTLFVAILPNHYGKASKGNH